MKNVILSRIFLGGIAPSFFDQHIHTTGNIRGGGAPRVALPGASADLCPAVATRSLGEAQIAHQAGARSLVGGFLHGRRGGSWCWIQWTLNRSDKIPWVFGSICQSWVDMVGSYLLKLVNQTMVYCGYESK